MELNELEGKLKADFKQVEERKDNEIGELRKISREQEK